MARPPLTADALRAAATELLQGERDLWEVAVRHGLSSHEMRDHLADVGVLFTRRGLPFLARTGPRIRTDQPQRREISGDTLKRALVDSGLPYACAVCDWKPPEEFPSILCLHHITPRAAGGSDHLDNLTLLCPNHHALAHAMFPLRHSTHTGPRSRASLINALRDPADWRQRAASRLAKLWDNEPDEETDDEARRMRRMSPPTQ